MCAYFNLVQDPDDEDFTSVEKDSFFDVLLGSELSNPMQRKLREKWEAQFRLPEAEDDGDDLEGNDSLQNDERMDREEGDEHPWSKKEMLTLFAAYKAGKLVAAKAAKKENRDVEVDWDDIADVIPGCNTMDCIHFYRTHSEMFDDAPA